MRLMSMRIIMVLFCLMASMFIPKNADGQCWLVEAFRTYNYAENKEVRERDENPAREEIKRKRIDQTVGVRVLFKESGELWRVLGSFADGSYSSYNYKYFRSQSEPCPPEHPTEVKRPGDWSEYEESISGGYELEDPHAGGAFLKLGDRYEVDVGVGKLVQKTLTTVIDKHHDACSGHTKKERKSWSTELDVTQSFGHIPIGGKGSANGFSGGLVQTKKRGNGTETVSVRWKIMGIPCDCEGLTARLELYRGDVRVNGRPVSECGSLPLDVSGAVIQTGKRSRVSLKLGNGISIHAASESVIDLATTCGKKQTTVLNLIKGKLLALVAKLGALGAPKMRIHVSSAVVGHRGEVLFPREFLLASATPGMSLMAPEDQEETGIEEMRPYEREMKTSRLAVFVDLAPHDHLYVKALRGNFGISIGNSQRVVSRGEDLHISLQVPRSKEEMKEISIEPVGE